MRFMSEALRRDRAPSEIMQRYAAFDQRLQELYASAGRDDPLPCGSGRKFKQCHGRGA